MSDLPIPGSVHLVAAGNGQVVEAGQASANGSIILHPHPSHDINDPLNWSRNRKRIATFCLFACESGVSMRPPQQIANGQDTLTAGMSTTALYSVLTPIEENTGIPLSTLNAGTGYSKLSRVPQHTILTQTVFFCEFCTDLRLSLGS
jgi:hypothetical protein